MEEYDRASDYQIKGQRGKSGRYLSKTPLEDFPKKDKITPKCVEDYDRHNGLTFNHIERMIKKSVGRPFDKVYHEICEYLKKEFKAKDYNSAKDAIAWYLEVHPMDMGGGVFASEEGRRLYHDFFVHPTTGLICKTNKEWANQIEKPCDRDYVFYHKDPKVYIDGFYYRKIKNIWYEVIVDKIPKPPCDTGYPYFVKNEIDSKYKVYDCVIKKDVSAWIRHDLEVCHGVLFSGNKMVSYESLKEKSDSYYANFGKDNQTSLDTYATIYAKYLRQLNKKQIKRLNLDDKGDKAPNIVR